MRGFEDIKNQCGLNKKDFFRYLQVRNCVEQLMKTNFDGHESGITTMFILG